MRTFLNKRALYRDAKENLPKSCLLLPGPVLTRTGQIGLITAFAQQSHSTWPDRRC